MTGVVADAANADKPRSGIGPVITCKLNAVKNGESQKCYYNNGERLTKTVATTKRTYLDGEGDPRLVVKRKRVVKFLGNGVVRSLPEKVTKIYFPHLENQPDPVVGPPPRNPEAPTPVAPETDQAQPLCVDKANDSETVYYCSQPAYDAQQACEANGGLPSYTAEGNNETVVCYPKLIAPQPYPTLGEPPMAQPTATPVV